MQAANTEARFSVEPLQIHSNTQEPVDPQDVSESSSVLEHVMINQTPNFDGDFSQFTPIGRRQPFSDVTPEWIVPPSIGEDEGGMPDFDDIGLPDIDESSPPDVEQRAQHLIDDKIKLADKARGAIRLRRNDIPQRTVAQQSLVNSALMGLFEEGRLSGIEKNRLGNNGPVPDSEDNDFGGFGGGSDIGSDVEFNREGDFPRPNISESDAGS
jgi:hypothetical protein